MSNTVRRPIILSAIIALLVGPSATAIAVNPAVVYSYQSQNFVPPEPSVMQASNGNFYGTTFLNGTSQNGSVYELTPSGTLTTLFSFSGGGGGSHPNGLVQNIDGNLYGTTNSGGTGGDGTIFKVTPTALTILHSFSGPDGSSPNGSLVADSSGNLYGATSSGGSSGDGVIFEYSAGGTYTVLHSFTGTDGSNPQCSLIISGTSLYGTTDGGGAHSDGTVFALNGSTLTTLHSFAGTDGANPIAGLIQGGDGNFYGCTSNGGANSNGAIFKITPSGALTVLHSLTASTDGSSPEQQLVAATDGNLYGTCQSGGSSNDGTLYKITLTGTFTLIHAFAGNTTDGSEPEHGLVQAQNGELYGSTIGGGASTAGTFYRDDIVPPTTTATVTGTGGNNGWYVSSVTVSLSATDPDLTNDPVAHTFYVLDGGSQITYSSPFTITPQAVHTLQYWSVDQDGNVENTKQITISIDETPPVTTASASGTQGGGGWYVGPVVTVTLSATDNLSGVAATYYTVDGGAQQTYSNPFTVTGDARHTLQYWSVDNAGNTETTHALGVNIEATPPVTTDSLSGPQGNNGWYTGPVTVTLTATSDVAGVAATYYTIDSGSQQTYSVPFQVSGDAVHTVTYWSVDNAGNIEAAHNQTIKIDGTPPTLTFGNPTPAANAAGWNNSTVSVPYIASDATSGVASSTPGSPVVFSSEGASQAQTITVTDVAGNVAKFTTPPINIDLIAPVTTASESGTQGINGWYTSMVTVTLAATDDLSGVSATCYTIDGGAQTAYTRPFTVTGDAKHTVRYWSVDVAGNVESAHTLGINIDTAAPVTTASLSGPQGLNGWYTGTVTVTLSATSDAAGVASTYFKIDGGSQQTYSAPFKVSGDAVPTVTFWSVDNAGNTETAHNQTVKIDGTPPTLTFGQPTPAANASGWNNASVSIPYTTSDATSGVASSTPGSPVTFTTQGANQTQTVTVTDVAGNSATFTTPKINIDLAAPVTTDSLSGPAGLNGWYTGAVTVALSATDNLSGVAATYYTIDGGSQQTYTTPFTVSGDAVHTITFWSVDNAGNFEATNTNTIKIDGAAPILTFGAATPAPNAAGWNNSTVSIPYTAADATSGVASATPGSPLTFAAEGANQSQTVTVTDVAGNSAKFTTVKVNIDLTAPVTTASESGTQGKGGWYTGAVTVTLAATDNLSGVASTYYTIDGGSQQIYATPFTVTGDAKHVVTYWSVDVAGNVESTHTIDINVDTTAPVTTASLSGPQGLNGWYTGTVTVTLSATDADSGMAATYYTVDGGSKHTYTTPFAVSGDAVHTITFWSVDNAGNCEAKNTTNIKIDGAAPTLTFGAATPAPNAAGWNNSTVNIPYTASDATSGVASSTPGSPVSFSSEGANQTQTVTVTDVAGNSAKFTTVKVNIDLTAPVTSASESGTQGNNGWYTGAVSVTLAATDNLSGVASTYYTVDGGALQTYSSPFTVSGDAKHVVTYWSVDVAGNVESAHTLNVNVDTTAPVTIASLSGPNGLNGWYTGAVTVTLSATDAGSGVASTYYTIDGGAQQTYTAPFTISGDAVHSITFWSVDNAGNSESPNSQTIKIDGTAPTLTFGAASPAPNAAGWNNSTVSIPYTAADATSGVASATPGSPVIFATEGANQTQTVTVTDVAGNSAQFTTVKLNIDLTAPVTTATESGSQGSNGWYTGAVTVTLAATDNLSGVASTYYTIDGGAHQTYSVPFTVTGDAKHIVTYWSVDVAGNVESTNTLNINVDTTAPVTTASLSGPNGTNGWYTGTVTVTLSATDAGSGIASTHYILDGGAQQTYTAPFIVSGDGIHTVTFWSIDNAGNSETPDNQAIKIDGAAPTLTFGAATPASNAAGWNNTTVSIPYTTADATSGVASATPGSPVTFSSEGANQTQTVTVTDVAGNSALFTTVKVNIDLTAPVTTASESGTQGSNGWYTGGVTVTLAATDNLSGVASTYYTVDGGAQQTYSAPITVSGDAKHVVTYWSVDVAGNVETTHALNINVDTTAPVTTASLSGPQGLNGWYTGPVTVTLSATDAGSGVASTYYTVDGGAQQTYTAPFTISNDGIHTITFWSVDNAGNTEKTNSQSIKIDGTAPTCIFGAANPAPNAAGWNNSTVSIPYTASDATSGVASATPGSPVTFSSEGTNQSKTVTVTDLAGNSAQFTTVKLNIDLTAPATTASTAGPQGLNGWCTGAVTVTLSATDNLSGVASTYYTIDGGSQQTYNAPFQVNSDGIHSVNYWSVDVAGNIEKANSLTIKVDASDPNLTFGAVTPAPNAAGWNNTTVSVPYTPIDDVSGVASATPGSPVTFNSEGASQTQSVTVTNNAGTSDTYTSPVVNIDMTAPVTTATLAGSSTVTVTLSATDNLSGVAATYYVIDTGSQQSYTAPFTLPTGGDHTVTYWSVDVAGNVEQANQVTVDEDTTPPTTTCSLSGPAGSNGWYTGAVTATLSATDPAGPSAVAATYYVVDSGSQETYAAPFNVSGDGVHVITFWSVDVEGNTESPNFQEIDIDGTPPTVTFAKPSPTANSAGWNDTAVAIPYTASDATSGLATVTPSNPITIFMEGESQSVAVTATDNAGNSAQFNTPAVNIDLTPPVTTASVKTVGLTTTVTLSAADNLSGVANTYYTENGGTQVKYTKPFSFTGSPTVKYWSVDVAGNVEVAHTLSAGVDPPVTTASLSGTAGNNGWYVSNVTVTLSVFDPMGAQNVAGTYYRLDGSAQQTYTGPFAITANGTHSLRFWSVDNEGDVETTNILSVKIDTTPPTVKFGSPSPYPNKAGWDRRTTSIRYWATDVVSGIASSSPASPIEFTTQGAGETQTVTVTDNAGNSTTVTSPDVNIDTTAPVTTASTAGTGPVTVTLSATDNLSGVALTHYRVDGGALQTYSGPFTITAAGAHTVRYWSVDIAGNTESASSLQVIILAPAPQLVSLTPNSAGTTSDASITVTGSNFTSHSKVVFNGVKHCCQFVNGTTLTLTILKSELKHCPQCTNVQVFDSSSKEYSNVLPFNVN